MKPGIKSMIWNIRKQKTTTQNNKKKKIQSETKDTLIEIKNNLQGNNSRVDEAENQINDMEHKEAKNNQSEKREGKRIQKKKMRTV